MVSNPNRSPPNMDRDSSCDAVGGISLLRSQLADDQQFSTNAHRNLPPAIAPNVFYQELRAHDMSPANPNVPVARSGSIRHPNGKHEYLPNTQIVLRGGFPPLPLQEFRDPEFKYIAPHYPPKSNDFYELTSDARLSEAYFVNAKLRRFRENPNLGALAAELEPVASTEIEKSVAMTSISSSHDRIYVGQGCWRQADEKPAPWQEVKQVYRHKHAQTPTQLRGRVPWYRALQQGTVITNEGFWANSEKLGAEDDDLERWDEKYTEANRRESQRLSPKNQGDNEQENQRLQATIHRSSECPKYPEQGPSRTPSKVDVRSRSKEKLNGVFEQVLLQHNERTYQEHKKQDSKGQITMTVREVETKTPDESSLHGTYTNIPGDRSGDNSRIGRTRKDLEATVLPRPAVDVVLARDDVSFEVVDGSDSDRS